MATFVFNHDEHCIGQVLLSTMVPATQATAFRDLAQAADLGVSAALRQMIAARVQAAEGREDLLPTDVAVGTANGSPFACATASSQS